LPLLKRGERAVGRSEDPLSVDKYLVAPICGDETIAFLEAEPLDPAVLLVSVVDLLDALAAFLRNSRYLALLDHLALFFDWEYELLATFVAGNESILEVHCYLWLL
jgi:hypothetical protein